MYYDHQMDKIPFTDLSALWLTYMQDLLGTAGLIKSGWSPGNLEEPLLQTLQMKVTRADFHGAIMKVIHTAQGHLAKDKFHIEFF